MKKISMIGSYLKKSYRIYSNELLQELQSKGFIDLRPSFLEILMFLCEHTGPSIKEVGHSCGLKKQTMTSHLNELEKRGYILRKTGDKDRRELRVHLTEYGEKFKIALLEVSNNLESNYLDVVGAVEIDRIIHTLENFHNKINKEADSVQTVLI